MRPFLGLLTLSNAGETYGVRMFATSYSGKTRRVMAIRIARGAEEKKTTPASNSPLG